MSNNGLGCFGIIAAVIVALVFIFNYNERQKEQLEIQQRQVEQQQERWEREQQAEENATFWSVVTGVGAALLYLL